MKKQSKVTVQQLKNEVQSEYGWLDYNVSDEKIEDWLNRQMPAPIELLAKLFVDFVLANNYQTEIQL